MPEPRAILWAKVQRRQSGVAEHAAWKLLRDRAARLIVEIDGPSHKASDQTAFDAQRSDYLEAKGWRVLRLQDDQVLSDPSGALETIRIALSET